MLALVQVGISTAFARGWRPAPDAPSPAPMPPKLLLDLLLRAEVAFVSLDDGLHPGYFTELAPLLAARRDSLPVTLVENLCPASKRAGADLCSLDRNESQVAVEAARDTIRVAGDLGARFVAVRLGEVQVARRLWPDLRLSWLRGELEEDDAPRIEVKEARAKDALRHLDPARRSLEQLARAAETYGITVGVRNPGRGIGFPSPAELPILLSDLSGAPIAPLLDAAAAHLSDAMGFSSLDETLAAWKGAPIALIADACGPIAGLPPRHGELDLPSVMKSLSQDAKVAFAASPLLEPRELQAGLESLRRLSG